MWKNGLTKIKDAIEKVIPMTLGSLVLFIIVIYLLSIVTRMMISNYDSNREIEVDRLKLVSLEQEIQDLEYEINYYETASFKEKEARSKLGYIAPGEKVISLPIDLEEEKSADSELVEVEVKKPNYLLWWEYFFEKEEDEVF